MHILLLTGPAAAGKNTISHALAHKRQKCAVIDVDLIRWMYRHPHHAPWEGEEGLSQRQLGVENTCLLAVNFAKHNIDVIILDVLVNETAFLYKERLKKYALRIVLLMPSYQEAQKRLTQRPHTLSEDEFNLVYKWQEDLTAFDDKIDNSLLSAEETAIKLNAMF